MELNRSLLSLHCNMLPQKSVNDAEEFSFASGEKETIIAELWQSLFTLLTRLSNMVLPQKSVNDAEEFSFASGEKEAIIVELKEEARILRARMENNPEVKRHAGAFSWSISCHFCPALVRWLFPLLPWFPFGSKARRHSPAFKGCSCRNRSGSS